MRPGLPVVGPEDARSFRGGQGVGPGFWTSNGTLADDELCLCSCSVQSQQFCLLLGPLARGIDWTRGMTVCRYLVGASDGSG